MPAAFLRATILRSSLYKPRTHTLTEVKVSCTAVFKNQKLTGSPDLNDVLKSLPVAKEAPFNAYDRQYKPACLHDTRVDLLQEIND